MRGILGIISRNDKLLLIQRSQHVRVPLAWCFPGGEIEPGEEQPIALMRELHEEIALRIEPGKLLTTQTKYEGRLILYCWSATILEGEPIPNPLEIADFAWLTPQEIRAKEGTLPGTTDILDAMGL